MDKIIRCITNDGAVMASAIDASDIVFTAKKLHHLSRSATAALGRLLCATSMMGAMLKQKDAIINLRVMGDGEKSYSGCLLSYSVWFMQPTFLRAETRPPARFRRCMRLASAWLSTTEPVTVWTGFFAR